MFVKKCVENDSPEKGGGNLLDEREMLVYAVFFSTPLKFFVHLDSLPSAPHLVSENEVTIVDPRLSKYWVLAQAHKKKDNSNYRPPILAFPEWANDVAFYEKIINGDSEYGYIWRSYKEKMDKEFAPKEYKNMSIEVQPNWFECISCLNIFEDYTGNELSVCPSCKLLQKIRSVPKMDQWGQSH